jgi:hypothetical protein
MLNLKMNYEELPDTSRSISATEEEGSGLIIIELLDAEAGTSTKFEIDNDSEITVKELMSELGKVNPKWQHADLLFGCDIMVGKYSVNSYGLKNGDQITILAQS